MVPKQTHDISVGLAALPLVTMLVLFTLGAAVMDMGTELLVLVMLGAAAVASIVAVRVGCSWDDIQRSTGEKLAQVLPAVLILLTIGMLIGTWVLGGTIPMLVYYGLKIVNPSFFVVTAFLATSVMSICTGTSWGSAGTIGVALMGMGVALGAPLGPTAGAIVSGAYFGDKLSPLSDSTNICAIGAGANLYAHIRMMLYTAIPSFILATLFYTFAARTPGGNGGLPESAQILLGDIETIYSLSILTALPVLVVIIGIVRRTPPVVAMATSSIVAVALGIMLQGFSVENALLSMVSGFKLGMVADQGIDPNSLGAGAGTLLARGGLYSMVNTLLVIISAFLLAGAMDVSGALDRLIGRLLQAVRSTFGLIAATMAAGTVMISLTSHGGVTALIVGGLFQKAYRERGFAPEVLSRSLEDSVTIVEPLLPWTVSAVYMASTLGVPTLSYAPWAIFCLSGPIMSLAYAATYDRWHIGLRRIEERQLAPDRTPS